MKKKRLLFLFMCLCALTGLSAQDTEFWFVAPQSGISTLNNGGFVFTNTSQVNSARVTITYYKSGLTETINIGPGEGARRVIDQPFSATNVENMMIDAGNVVAGGIHIESTEQLIAYYFFDANATKDIFALKGKAALGTKFFVPQTTDGFYINGDPGTGNSYPHAFDQIDIVATEDNTTVTVTLTRDCVKEYNTVTGTATADIPAGTYTVTLPRKGDVIKYLEKGHGTPGVFNTLAGTKIESDKPVAVSSTEEVTNHDMIADQIIPVDKVGTLFPIVKAFSDKGGATTGWPSYSDDRVYIMATEDGTDVKVNLPDGTSQTLASGLNAGQGTSYSMGDLHTAPYAVSIKTTKPSYCLQTTAQSYHPGGAVLPSIYSVSASKLSFYQFPAPGPTERNAIFLVFRDTCEKYFEIMYGGNIYNLMEHCGIPTVGATPAQTGRVPGIAGWSYLRATLPVAADNQVITISNSESVFSLGYFSGSLDQVYATFGYLSAFGDWKFDPDTIYRCAAKPRPVTLMGGYAANYKWTLPDSSIRQGADLSVLKARTPGMYILEMDQEFQTLTDTCWVIDLAFSASIKRKPNKPAKISVPQQFGITANPSLASMLKYRWTFEGGTPSTSVAASPKVVWHSTGPKKVTLHLSATAGSGANEVTCDTT
ncbi:IgGFc-binding protein, partial [Tannerella sp.]|uniref:IgGFc-binding protein n=1 Tax=Tannerella sp. TaxID=2382127 RepID=UPI0026DD3674